MHIQNIRNKLLCFIIVLSQVSQPLDFHNLSPSKMLPIGNIAPRILCPSGAKAIIKQCAPKSNSGLGEAPSFCLTALFKESIMKKTALSRMEREEQFYEAFSDPAVHHSAADRGAVRDRFRLRL
nr:hypothetical protein [uncultured Oscillibacter sp.]